jgi:membrane-associated phospholipid phosphatase
MDSTAFSTDPAVPHSVRRASSLSWLAILTAETPASRLLRISLLLAAGLMIIPFDTLLVEWIGRGAFPGEFDVFLHRAEPFGHGYGVLFILATLWIVGKYRWKHIGMLFGCSLGAGLAADLIKLFVGRLRPGQIPEDHIGGTFTGIRFLWESESMGQILDTTHHSFPSAHTATACGFAIGLSQLFPHGRRWFFFLAGLVALQRVALGYHFPSDTIVGAALGLFVGSLVTGRLKRDPLAKSDNRLESNHAV